MNTIDGKKIALQNIQTGQTQGGLESYLRVALDKKLERPERAAAVG